jgi:hypothetical protein
MLCLLKTLIWFLKTGKRLYRGREEYRNKVSFRKLVISLLKKSKSGNVRITMKKNRKTIYCLIIKRVWKINKN